MATDNQKNETHSGEIVKAFSLWNGRGKVKYSAINKEAVTIPAGAKILVFENDGATTENRRPHVNICFIVKNE